MKNIEISLTVSVLYCSEDLDLGSRDVYEPTTLGTSFYRETERKIHTLTQTSLQVGQSLFLLFNLFYSVVL